MITLHPTRVILPASIAAVLVSGCAPESPALRSPVVVEERQSYTTPGTSILEPEAAGESAAVAESEPDDKPAAPFYSVAHYDDHQDLAGDLTATTERATAENKRILLQVGGEWCGWCHRISDYMETNERVRQLVDEHFIVMKVTYPSEHAESFLSQYPDVPAYPHFFVLEPDGTFLHSQGTAELEHEKSYNEEVFCQFLNDWTL